MKRILVIAAAAALSLGAAGGAKAEDVDYAAQVAALGGDATAGQRVYNRCKACHVIDKEQNRVGPHQVGIIGRPAAVVEGFRYSNAMAEAGEGGLVWDVETLLAYLENPRAYLKGTKMAFAGLKKEEDLNNVIAYLLEAGGVYEAPTN